ncbi:MAG: alpha/beta fold hydrolase [Propionibacteriaceae bacterium]
MELEQLTADDGAVLDVCVWRPEHTARGLIQIAHGMAEHASRYDELGQRLAAAGWLVVAGDHRGHGARAKANGQLGIFPARGYDQIVDDLCVIGQHYRGLDRTLPWIPVGHSMGSFLVRLLASRVGRELAGLVVIGTGSSQGPLAPVAKTVVAREVRKRGVAGASTVMDKLAFGGFNKAFRPTRTPADWLSRDAAQVDAYLADPLCGFVCSAGFYRELIHLVELVNRDDIMRAVPSSLPILLLSGAADPVGRAGSGVRAVERQLRRCGARDVTMKLYPQARHEILNETNRDEVIAMVMSWLDDKA